MNLCQSNGLYPSNFLFPFLLYQKFFKENNCNHSIRKNFTMADINFSSERFKITKLNIAVVWVLLTGASAFGLQWLNTISAQTGNVLLSQVSNMFLLLFLFSIIIEFAIYMFYNHRFWGDREANSALGLSVLFLYAGLLIMYGLNSFGGLSLLDNMYLLSQSSETLTAFQNLYMNVIVAPTIEENFFRIAFPVFLIIAFKGILKEIGFENNYTDIISFVTALIASNIGFALFHSQGLSTGFFVFAFVFGFVLSILYLADMFYNIFPSISVVPALLVGLHMGNNLMVFGPGRALNVLLGAGLPGYVILGFFVIGLVIALDELTGILFGSEVLG